MIAPLRFGIVAACVALLSGCLAGRAVDPEESVMQIPLASDEQAARLTGSNETATAKYYEVRRGDTIYSIARRYNVKPDELIKANMLGDGKRIEPGQKLRLPSAREENNAIAVREGRKTN